MIPIHHEASRNSSLFPLDLQGPLIDGHVHFGDLGRIGDLERYVDQLGLDQLALLSLPLTGTSADRSDPAGRDPLVHWNPEVLGAKMYLERKLGKGNIHCFGCFDNRALINPNFPEPWNPAYQVETLYGAGFSGIKMWEGKPELQAALGINLDDPKLIDAYSRAGELGMPVLIHVADPVEFWNTRGVYGSPKGHIPAFEQLMEQTWALCRKASGTRFIFPHLLFLAHDLPRLGKLLDEFPLVSVDLAPGNYFFTALGGIENLNSHGGSQPRRAQEFFSAYSDRILFGTDSFFLPMDLPLLPGTSLGNNLERFIRLTHFLGTEDVGVSPYPGAGSAPLFRGLGLGKDVMNNIMGMNFGRVIPEKIEGKKDPRPYLDMFFSSIPESGKRKDEVFTIINLGYPKV